VWRSPLVAVVPLRRWLIVDDADDDEAASAAAFVARDVVLVVSQDGGATIAACDTAMCRGTRAVLAVVGRNGAIAASAASA
jgi:hypothetical protein